MQNEFMHWPKKIRTKNRKAFSEGAEEQEVP